MRKILFLLLLPFTVIAQKNYADLLEQYMQAQVKVNDFSGVVLVVKQGKPLLRQGYGLADREWKIANTPDTKFRLASITKQFTAACILQLIEQSKLSLNDKLSKFYPDFPRGDSVTIHMLLNHTSGITSYTDLPVFGKVARLTWTNDSIVSFFKTKPYNFPPGSRFRYNNSGYFLLGCIIEKISGLSYANYLRTNILDKLGMHNSGTDRLDSVLPMRARGYAKEGKKFINADYISMEWPFSAGAMYSTLDDLYKWDRGLYGTAVIGTGSKEKMFTPGMSRYGYGVIIDSMANRPRIWHNGGIPGFSTRISRFINEDLCIIVFSNNESSADGIDACLSHILFDLPVIFPYEHKEVKIDTAILSRYIGRYDPPLRFIVRDGKLWRQRDGGNEIRLIPESQTKFFYADGSDRQIEFEVDASGKVIRTWLINNGLKSEMKRLD